MSVRLVVARKEVVMMCLCCICVCLCVHTCVCVCVCVSVYACAHMYSCIRTTLPSPHRTIPHTVKFEELELQVMVKTQGFFASSHGNLLGLTVLQLRNHLEQSFSQQLDLVGRLKISPAGEAIISVLLQRGTDELAKEFVSLKQEERKGMQATAGN